LKKITFYIFAVFFILLFSCATAPVTTPAENRSSALSFADTAEKVLPANIHIRIVNKKTHITPEGWDYLFNPFSPTPGNVFEERRDFFSEGLGAGVIIKQSGNRFYAVTNRHVISDADSISVKFHDGEVTEAVLLGFDERKDIAIIYFDSNNKSLRVIGKGNSDLLRVGDWVLAVGSPFGFHSSVTAGIVSALGRRNNANDNISDFIQTDASINTGNSGGALVNINGELVGINSWITTTTGGNMGLGFAIPVNNIKKSIDDIIAYGEVRYGWIGVIAGELPEFEKRIFQADNAKGVMIFQTIPNGPAYLNGLLPGDFLLNISGVEVPTVDSLLFTVGESRVGSSGNFALIRDGKLMNKEVTFGLRQRNNDLMLQGNIYWPGINVITIDREHIRLSNFDSGVIITLIEAGAVFENFMPGDIITEINGVPILNSRDFFREINKNKNLNVIKYFRDGRSYIEEVRYN